MADEELKYGVFNKPEESNPSPVVSEIATDLENNRYLLFSILDIVFATPLLEAKEVLEMVEYQRIPNTTEYFLGIANVRGDVIGIVDLKAMLNVKENQNEQNDLEKPVLIVFQTSHGLLGIKVDAIRGVKDIDPNEIDTQPHIKARVPQEYLLGVAKTSNQLISVIAIKKILNDDDMLTIKRSMAS